MRAETSEDAILLSGVEVLSLTREMDALEIFHMARIASSLPVQGPPQENLEPVMAVPAFVRICDTELTPRAKNVFQRSIGVASEENHRGPALHEAETDVRTQLNERFPLPWGGEVCVWARPGCMVTLTGLG